LTQAQRERLERYVPKCLAKLERRQRFHVVLVGDGVSRMMTRDRQSQNVLESMHGHFLAGLEAEFYYTGGVLLANPVGDHPAKNRDHKGEEITFEQFTEPDGTVFGALRNLSSRALLNPTDLVLLHVGLGEFRQGLVLDRFAAALSRSLEVIREAGAEAVVIGPTLVQDAGTVGGWGGTRHLAATARLVAERAGVMFLDPGAELARTRPIPGDGAALERAAQLSAALDLELFDYGPGIKETVLVNPASHLRAGRGLFRQFLDGLPAAGWELAVRGTMARPREIDAVLTVKNLTDRERRGFLAALNLGRSWEADTLAHDVILKPGESKELRLLYRQRAAAGEGDDAAYDPCEFPGGMLACPVLLSDLLETRMMDASGPLGPVQVTWQFAPQPTARGTFPMVFWMTNPGEAKLSGTYELWYGNQRARVGFQLGPGQTKEFSNQCSLPKGTDRWRARSPVALVVETGNAKFALDREVEVTRNPRLGQAVPLQRASETAAPESEDGPVLRIGASETSLDLSFEFPARELQAIPGKPSVLLELALDGRPFGEHSGVGFVEPVQITFSPEEDYGTVGPIQPAAFGPGYDKHLDPRGIQARLGPEQGGMRRIEVSLPRLYFFRHDWSLGDSESRLGLLARLHFARRDANGVGFYPAESSWANAVSLVGRQDASGLPMVELADGEPETWSVRVF
jgi:hypothetical protein